MIPYGRQDIDDADIEAVVRVLRSDYLTTGPVVPAFEKAMAERVGAQHAVAVNSATSALHIACMALELGDGDTLWTTPNTFLASANCARYCGADVDFVDIDPATANMSAAALATKLEHAERSGTLPKVVVAVHFAGASCDMAAIGDLARRYGFRVIEDASHAVGARHRNAAVGACMHSDVTIFSFHPVKILTCGEGGMALTNDAKLARSMELSRSHASTRDPAEMRFSNDAPWYYEQIGLGYNYRMTDIQAALGLSQLNRLDDFLARRNALAARYDRALADLPVRLPRVLEGDLSSWHLYTVGISAPADRDAVFTAMRKSGIGVNVHYIPVHLQPYYRDLGFHEGQFPHAEAHGREALTLPLFATLSEEDQDRVIAALADTLG